jgi:hypothetical protein
MQDETAGSIREHSGCSEGQINGSLCWILSDMRREKASVKRPLEGSLNVRLASPDEQEKVSCVNRPVQARSALRSAPVSHAYFSDCLEQRCRMRKHRRIERGESQALHPHSHWHGLIAEERFQ